MILTGDLGDQLARLRGLLASVLHLDFIVGLHILDGLRVRPLKVTGETLAAPLESFVLLDQAVAFEFELDAVLVLELPLMLHLRLAKRLRESRLEVEGLDDVITDCRKVQQDLDHIGLLAVVSLVVIAVLEKFLPLRHMRADVTELLGVVAVTENVVKRSALHGFHRPLHLAHAAKHLFLHDFDGELLPHILGFGDHLVRLLRLEHVVEVRQVLVDLDVLSVHAIARGIQDFLRDNKLDDDDESRDNDKNLQWLGPGCIVLSDVMSRGHDVILIAFECELV